MLGYTILDPKHRARISSCLKRRLNKLDLDTALTSDDDLFQEMAEDFNNLLCECKNPREELHDRLDGRKSWDSNNVNIIIQMRGRPWLRKTNDNHVKKHQKCLNECNKETGGGNGASASSQNYLDTPDHWIPWLFWHCNGAGFLLSQSICSKMQRILLKESGFNHQDDSTPCASAKRNESETLLKDNRDK